MRDGDTKAEQQPLGNDGETVKLSDEVNQKRFDLARHDGFKPEMINVTQQIQPTQKVHNISKMREAILTVRRQSADRRQSMVALDLSACDKRRKTLERHGHCNCKEEYENTIKAFKNNIDHMHVSFTHDLKESNKARFYYQKQLEDETTKSVKQDTQIRALQVALSETQAKLQNSQDVCSAHEKRFKDINQKSVVLLSRLQTTTLQLDTSKATVKQLHEEVWPLRDERARLQAEITTLKTSQNEKQDKISDLKRMRQEHAVEIKEAEAKIETLEKQRSEAATRAESWRMKWEDLKDGQDRAIMYSDVSGDITMIDAPGNPIKVDIPWVRKAGEENIKLRLQIEDLTKNLEGAKAAVKENGEVVCNDVSEYRLQLEATKQELLTVKNELDVVVKGHLGLLRDIQMDPTNRYHPIYQKIQGLEQENLALKEQLLDAKALSWDRRSSMVP